MLDEINSVIEDMPRGADDTPRILALPEDVLIRIVRFLGPQDVVILGSVCKRFVGPATEDRLVWAPICRAVVGSNASTSPAACGAPSFQRLYSRLLRLYGGLLAGPWLSRAEPLGSLLLAFPSPPHIVGGIVVSLRLAELGVTVVPVFRVSYDSATDGAIASCLRGGNTFGALLRRLLFMAGGNEGEEAVRDLPERVHPAELQLTYEVEEEVGGGDIQDNGAGRGAGGQGAAAADAVQPDERGGAGAVVGAGIERADAAAGGGAAAGGFGGTPASSGAAPVGESAPRQHPGGSGAGSSEGTTWSAGGSGTRRRPAYCCGPGGPQLAHFSFSCSAGCRHQEVEAVCRWAPAATVTRSVVQEQDAGSTDSGSGGGSTGGGSGGGGGGGGGDEVIDLDVLAAHSLEDRGNRVAMALRCLAVRNLTGPVSYSRLRPPEQRSDWGGCTPPLAGPATIAAVAAVAVASAAAAPAGPGLVRPHAVAAPVGAVGVPRGVPTGAAHPLVCVWRGTYGAHGIEFLQVQPAGPNVLVARKLTGDDNVPAGEISFRIFLDRPGAHATQRDKPFRLPPDYASRADVAGLGGLPGAPAGGAVAAGGAGGSGAAAVWVLDAFAAEGRVAGSGFDDPQWISAEAVVLGRHTFGVLWHDIRSFSVFRRVQLPRGYPV